MRTRTIATGLVLCDRTTLIVLLEVLLLPVLVCSTLEVLSARPGVQVCDQLTSMATPGRARRGDPSGKKAACELLI